jgi:urocanate hydratase
MQTGQTALCVACLNNMVEVVKLLMKKKILLDVQDKVTTCFTICLFYIDTGTCTRNRAGRQLFTVQHGTGLPM